VKSCDYDRVALGTCRNNSLSACMYVTYYTNFLCIDPSYLTSSLNANLTNITGEQGGQYSRCFNSDLRVSGNNATKYAYRCYSVICSGTTLTIKIGKTYGLCTFPGQNITIKGYDGNLTCPMDFKSVCAVVRCPDECNGNGICLHGTCLCSSQYTGSSCNQLTSLGYSSLASFFSLKGNKYCL
jgi:hypothetical protein